MANETITSFDKLLPALDTKDQGLLLSLAYDSHSSQQDLQHAIYSVLTKYPELKTNVGDIVDTAPKGESYEIEHQAFDEEESRRRSDYSHSGPAGELINHEKYQADILDSLAKDHQQSAIDELNALRKDPELSGWEKQRAIVEKFRDILNRNTTAEGTLQEQQELLAKQLEEGQVGKEIDRTDENGTVMLDKAGKPVKTTDAAQAIRKRSGELVEVRTQERDELATLQNSDIVKKHVELQQAQQELSQLELRKRSLTFEEQAQRKKLQSDVKMLGKNIRGRGFSNLDREKLGRFLELRGKHSQLDQTALRNIDGLVKRFSRLTIPEQDVLLRRILARQQRRTRGELWKIFDQKDRGRLTGLYKKTLTRSQRRQILNFQKSALYKRQLYFQQFPIVKHNFSPRITSFISYDSDDDSNDSDHPGFERLQKAKNFYDNIQKLQRLGQRLKNFFGGGGGEAAGAGGAAAGGAGGGAGGVVIIVIVVIIFLILLIIAMFILLPHGQDNEKVTGVTCGDAPTLAAAGNAENFRSTLRDRYHVDVNVDPTFAPDHTNVIIEKQIYSDLCLLFGDSANSDLTQPAVFNTFANLTVGTDDQWNRHEAMLIHYTVTPEDSKKNCGITPTSITKPNDAYWDINNPLECLSQPGVFDFLFAQNLAQNLLLQQKYLNKGTVDVFNNFTQNVFSTGNLPTQTCLNTRTPEDCFSDMVAAYLTWGQGYIASPPIPPANESANTNTTDTSQTLTLASLLGTLGIYPQTFPTYYTFAKTNLFNNLDIFSIGGPGSDLVAKTADYIAKHLVGSWHNTPSPDPLSLPDDINPTSKTLYFNSGDFVCTNMVISSYDGASTAEQKPIPDDETLILVDNLVKFWQKKAQDSNSGFIFYDYWNATDDQKKQIVQTIKPGFAIFWHTLHTPDWCDNRGDGYIRTYCHTGIVYAVNINTTTGEGYIETREANTNGTTNGVPGSKLTVTNWEFLPGDTIGGFGTIGNPQTTQ